MYNFETIADNLIEKFDKKLASTQKDVMKQMRTLFDFLSDKVPYEQRQQLEQAVEDILSDRNKSQSTLYMETMNKVVRAVREVIGD